MPTSWRFCNRHKIFTCFFCSHWVTDNLLAMSRPNSANIATTISEFQRLGIKSIVNVQVVKGPEFGHARSAKQQPGRSNGLGFTFKQEQEEILYLATTSKPYLQALYCCFLFQAV